MITDKFFNQLVDLVAEHLEAPDDSKKAAIIKLIEERPVFEGMTEEQIVEANENDLCEMKDFYGSWKEMRRILDELENNENEAAWERSQQDDYHPREEQERAYKQKYGVGGTHA
jgi:hypothetical protein